MAIHYFKLVFVIVILFLLLLIGRHQLYIYDVGGGLVASIYTNTSSLGVYPFGILCPE